jgi:hypothetical protein
VLVHELDGHRALAGILSVRFALMLVTDPGTGAQAVVWIVGLYAIVFGVLLMIPGFRLRRCLEQQRKSRVREQPNELSSESREGTAAPRLRQSPTSSVRAHRYK